MSRLFTFLVISLIGLTASAATVTSVQNGNWSDTNTWDCACVPGISDDITVAHDVVLDGDYELEGPASLTINLGVSLVGDLNSRIGYDLTAGSPVIITNNGLLEVGFLNQEGSGSTDNNDLIFTNNGVFNQINPSTSSGSSAPFFMRHGTVINNVCASMTFEGTMYIGGGNGTIELQNYGNILFNGSFRAHSSSIWTNYATGKMVMNSDVNDFGGLEQNNYGCICVNETRIFEKTNNVGNGYLGLHDGSSFTIAAGFQIQSQTTLIGFDNDGDDSNNACLWSAVDISNSGVITGELYLNDPDGSVGGTIGPDVTVGTDMCGLATPTSCLCDLNEPCASCSIEAPNGAVNIVCDNGGTDGDASDDTFTFDVFVTGTDNAASWTANDPNATTGAYDVIVTMGPYPVSGGDLNFTITDDGDSNCTTDISVTVPTVGECDASTPCPNPNCLGATVIQN